MLFHATTLYPEHDFAPRDTLERTRVLDFLDRHPTAGIISWMIGPIGSGKTTIALQWASKLDRPIQYVSVREPRLSPDSMSQPPDEFGEALATMLNACSDDTKEPSADEIGQLLARVVSLSKAKPRCFILDDLELIRRSAMIILQELLVKALPELKVDRALVISRTIDSNILGGLQALRSLRMVLPPTLAFDRQEVFEAQRIGVFGSATPEQVENARIQSSGWITGMLTLLVGNGGHTISESEFRNEIMNSLLLHQPPQILHVMMASACLPWNHVEIWERWFEHLEIPQWLVPSTITQIPTSNESDPEGSFGIAPVLRNSLRDLRSISVSDKSIHDLLTIAIDWYIENEEISAATTLATENDLQSHLLQALRSVCAQQAAGENWSAIVEILKLVPQNQLIEEPDLTFWYFHGLVESDQWAAMKQIQDEVTSKWSESSDPLVLGRAHLVQSWNAYMLNRADAALNHATTAHETLPSSAYRERLWSAGTASIAQSLRGYVQEARRWSAQANYDHTFLADPSRWWHNNAGPLRVSWLAITGMVDAAYEMSARQVRDLGGEHDPNTMRYLLLMAQIDIERLELQSAEQLLENAKVLISDKYAQRLHYRIARANLYRAAGDYESALELLSQAQKPTGQQFDQFARELFTRARLALDAGDVNTADLYLSGAPSGDKVWPKNFGDAHPGLVGARLRFLMGRHDDAIAMAQSVANEAWHRGHTQFVITANAMLAHFFHALDRVKPRDRVIETAASASGSSEYQFSYKIDGQDVRELTETKTDGQAIDRTSTVSIGRNSSLDRLTTREIEVLTLVAQGLSNKQIADQMYISVSTVKNHLASAYDKLGTNNRRGATRIATDLGLIKP